jgi:hypothetical protein
LSLPRLTGNGFLDAIGNVPYLEPCNKRVHSWTGQLENNDKFRIGICWQGNPGYKGDRLRSIPLFAFEPLCDDSTVELWALQKGVGLDQAANFGAQEQLVIQRAAYDVEFGAFMDTAALAGLMDLVVTSDTAVAHLAGAMGLPVWLALPFVADWRWGQSGNTTPYYPTMRLFRQQTHGDWDGVFLRIKRALIDFRAEA